MIIVFILMILGSVAEVEPSQPLSPTLLIPTDSIYIKKGKCVESLTYVAPWLTLENSNAIVGTSTQHMPIEHTQT